MKKFFKESIFSRAQTLGPLKTDFCSWVKKFLTSQKSQDKKYVCKDIDSIGNPNWVRKGNLVALAPRR